MKKKAFFGGDEMVGPDGESSEQMLQSEEFLQCRETAEFLAELLEGVGFSLMTSNNRDSIISRVATKMCSGEAEVATITYFRCV
mgnify:CR=1 FL=1